MQFVIIAKDGTDDKALERRMAAREAHIKLGDEGVEKGNFLMGTALLNDKGEMCGSMMIVDFPSRKELDEWLKIEPYVTRDVWQDIEIYPAKIGPSFEKFLPKKP